MKIIAQACVVLKNFASDAFIEPTTEFLLAESRSRR